MEPLLAASSADFPGRPAWPWFAFLGLSALNFALAAMIHRFRYRQDAHAVVLYSMYGTRRDGGVAVPAAQAGRA